MELNDYNGFDDHCKTNEIVSIYRYLSVSGGLNKF